MKAIIIDTETTGMDEPEVVEVAHLPVDTEGSIIEPGGWCGRFKPSKPISLGALATHHILDEELANCPPSATFTLPAGTDYIIGHNVDFDWQAIGKPDVKRICTLALSRAAYPDADSHSLGAMIYLTNRANARLWLNGAHSAGIDVVNTGLLLRWLISEARVSAESFDALWQASELARVPKTFTFGKHKGTLIADAPRDYRAWMMRQPDVDPYLMQALRAA